MLPRPLLCCWKKALLLLLATLAPLAAAHAARPSVIDANTLLYWSFDEGADATSFADTSGNGRTGTPYSIGPTGITPGAEGVMGNGLSMAGASAGSNIFNLVGYAGFSEENFPTREFTVQAWIKAPTAQGDDARGNIIATQRMAGANLIWSLGVVSGDTPDAVKLKLVFGNSSLTYTTDDLVLGVSDWWMVALVATAAETENTQDYQLFLARNGATSLVNLGGLSAVEAQNWGDAHVNGRFSVGGDGLRISGDNASEQARRYNGMIDEVIYSNVARSESYLLAAAIPEASGFAMLVIGATLIGGGQWLSRRRR